MKIKAIFFDLDDTLINSKKAESDAICEFKNAYSKFEKIDNNEFSIMWKKVAMDNYYLYNNRMISFDELKIRRMQGLFKAYGTEITAIEAKEKFEKYYEIYEKNWILFNDTIETLNKLKNKYKLAIITNGNGIQQRKKIKNTDIENYFNEITISEEVGVSKPDKKIFEITYMKMKLQPQECIMVGDMYDMDIEGGLNAGIKSIWIDRKNEDKNYQYKVNKLLDILKFINN